ncbi:DUF4389 domain-containing protein [Candidatus Woesearchaeota archaeon]|jgi:hypothetical protein|nr:DUF4389 domain-containing protein [Candidatus Woesearchaeota archaeon]MBT4367967.1 DUF4389 domain-containing protein [Candidatus Woesearchaeota archaeon]MBT4712455.1 DUF4389 domain-containing protein [Candidatus Woesearchaeota archaeon]MBT6639368.1 DUF4389 domain-containing protein [Candidatus Woesearchaeota archaeon]MBT7133540.1 DUF4389 domain-containing protein [Candidatus Woesearchaeota archaeon]
MSPKKERLEALMRILVCIVSGIIFGVWMILVRVLVIVQWIVVIITGKKINDIAKFCDIWNRNFFVMIRYLTFVKDKRPFPFGKLK